LASDTVEVTLEFPQGSGSIFGAPALSSAIGRPFRRLFESGVAIGRVVYVFFRPPDGELRTLGALCYTSRGKAIFFPGLRARRVLWHTEGKEKMDITTKSDEALDHITLEPNFKTWHASILTSSGDKETRIPRRRTRQMSKELTFWFALSVGRPSALEATPNTAILGPFPVSSTYSRKAAALVLEARRDCVWRTIQLHDDQPLLSDQFVMFEFYIDRSGRMKLWLRNGLLRRHGRRTPILFPVEVPAAQGPPTVVVPLPYRNHDVEVPGFRGCFTISAYRATGMLTGDAVLSGY
jgi:hypothetical protein